MIITIEMILNRNLYKAIKVIDKEAINNVIHNIYSKRNKLRLLLADLHGDDAVIGCARQYKQENGRKLQDAVIAFLG